MRKRLLSLFLALVMVLGMMPMTASAEAVSLPIMDTGKVDITDAQLGPLKLERLEVYLKGTSTYLPIDSATQDGTTIDVVLDASVNPYAEIQAGFGGSGQGIPTISGNTCILSDGTGTMKCTVVIRMGPQIVGGANYTINFTTAASGPKYTVNLEAGDGYTISGKDTVQEGKNYTFTVTVQDTHTGTPLVKANGTELTDPAVAGNQYTYTIENVTEDQNVTVEGLEEKTTYAVTLTPGDGYTISSDDVPYHGEDYTFCVAVDDADYKLGADGLQVLVNGEAGKAADNGNGSYTISALDGDKTITVTGIVERQLYTVEQPSVEGVSFQGDAQVREGKNYSFSLNVDSAYNASGMMVKNYEETLTPVVSGSKYTYTISQVDKVPQITVTGVEPKIQHMVAWETDPGYTITGANFAYDGESYSFTVAINKGYKADPENGMVIKVNGDPLEPTSGKYVVTSVTNELTITVEGVVETGVEPTVILTGNRKPNSMWGYVDSITIDLVQVEEYKWVGDDAYIALIPKTADNAEAEIQFKTGGSRGVSGATNTKVTLVGGKADASFATKETVFNKDEWKFNLHFSNKGFAPVLATGVNATDETTEYAGFAFEMDLAPLFIDKFNKPLSYFVQVDEGDWEAIEGSTYSITPETVGDVVLKFKANNGKLDSEDVYQLTLHVADSSDTYNVTVNVPEGFSPSFYSSDETGEALFALTATAENGRYTVAVPSQTSVITWTCEGAVCGTAQVAEDTELSIYKVTTEAKTPAGDVDTGAVVKITEPGGRVLTVGESSVALLAAGNYTFAVTPSSAFSSWNAVTLEDQTIDNDGPVAVQYTLKGSKSVTVPKDAQVVVYYQNGNYKGEKQTAVYSTENADGTVTYHYSCTGKVGNTTASGYVYRATMDGKITKAGYLNAVNNVTLSWSEQDKTPSYRGADESHNYSTTTGDTQRRAGDNVLMTVNSTGHLALPSTKDVGVFRNWAIINTDTENVAIEPDFHFDVVAGDNVVAFTDLGSGYGNNWQKLSKTGNGTAFVEVSFDAIHIVDGYPAGGFGGAYAHIHNYTYNASNPNTTGLIVVQTDGKVASDVTFNIASDRKSFSRQWDAEVDTYYILEDTGLLTLTPTASNGIQSVAVSNDKGATWTTLEATEGGAYVATVVPGNNIIRVTNGNGQTAYQVVRALKLDLRIENQTDPSKGEEFAPGETVRLYVTGLISPIGKMGGIYNPQAVQGAFAGSDGTNYSITGPNGVTGSYAFNGRTYYIDNIVIPESGQLTLSGKYLVQNGFNLQLGKHRGITMAGTGGAAGGAEGSSGASVLPVIVLGKEETKRPELTGEDTVEVSMRLNQWKEIDLSQYFTDEDSETLTYYINEGQAWTPLTSSTYLYYPAGDGEQRALFTALDESMTLEDVDNTTPMLTLVADVEEVPSEVTVTFSVSQGVDKYYTTDQGKIMIPHEIKVPYFDISLYGLTDSYYNPRCYAGYTKPGTIGGGTAGTRETAEGIVTPLHVFIWVTEVYQLGYDPDLAGKGYSHNQGLEDYFGASESAGSAFVNLWNGTNMNYYVNMEYPLGYPETGSTCDQIALYNNDVISCHFIADKNVKGSSFAAFVVDDGNGTYNLEDDIDATVDKGETITLTAYQSVADWVKYVTSYVPSADAKVTYVAADNLSANTSDWTEIGTTNSEGQIVINTATMKAGTYYIAVQGAVDNAASKEREAALFMLTVEGDAFEESVTVDTSKLNGTLPEENISFSGDTMTIAPAENTPACVVLVKNGDTYTRVAATKNGNNYDFDVSALPEGASIVVAVKGDLNGNGEIDSTETVQINAAQLGKLTNFDAFQKMVVDINGNGEIDSNETVQINAAQLGKIKLGW